MTISQLLTSLLTVVAVLAMMVSISPLLALITLLTVPMSLLATRAIARRSQRLFMAQWTSTGRLNAHIEETYSGFTVVKTFGHQAAAREQFRRLNDDVYRASFGAQFISGLVQPATAFIGNLGYVAVAVVGGVQVATGHITLGNIQAFIQYVRQFNTSAEPDGRDVQHPAVGRGQCRAGVRPARRTRGVARSRAGFRAARCRRAPGAAAVASSFEHVNFAYRPGTPVIEDLSMVAEPGSTVAIVGPTGAGKTTLVNLLMRFYDVDSGRILVDGVDITTMSRHALRSRIGMVLQDTWLFDGTIAENIAYGRPDASADEVVEAAKAAYVDRFVHTLPAGYRDPGHRRRRQHQRRREAAHHHRARISCPPAAVDPGRGDQLGRYPHRGPHPARPCASFAGIGRVSLSRIVFRRFATADRILVVEAGGSSSKATTPSCSPGGARTTR